MKTSIALLMMCIGCGGDDGTGSQLPGGNVDLKESVAANITVEDDGRLRIVQASTTGLCADARATPPIDRQGQHFIVIELSDVGGANTTAPTAPGTYTIYPNTGTRPAKSASFVAGAFDDTCQTDDAFDGQGQSGSVVLTAIGTRFQGTYDVVLNTDDHVTGTFDAAPCTELQAAATNQQHACMP
ncbi:MAG TPA: hypothetical protein VL326_22445 [Kofleriaceae bacterium]|nr:hypothetical protein [Kofleriaceae bacterium]